MRPGIGSTDPLSHGSGRSGAVYSEGMGIPAKRKTVIRIAGLAVAIAGGLASGAALLRFVRSIVRNAIDGGSSLTQYPEYYRQIGTYYSRGFTTGFFFCYFLMLFAVIAGSWVDEHLKARRAAAARARATPAGALHRS